MKKSLNILIYSTAALVAMGAQAQINVSTVPNWDGSSTISAFGNPNTATYGETFVAPAGAATLDSFSFYLSGPADLAMQGFVAPWGGSLFGGGGGSAGALSYTSSDISYFSQGFGFTQITVNIPGGVAVTPGQQYVMGLTVSGNPEYDASSGTIAWGDTQFAHVAGDLGGGFAFDNNGGAGLGSLVGPWDNFGDFGDAAFDATFSAGVPDVGSTLFLLGLGLTGISAARRRFLKN